MDYRIFWPVFWAVFWALVAWSMLVYIVVSLVLRYDAWQFLHAMQSLRP